MYYDSNIIYNESIQNTVKLDKDMTLDNSINDTTFVLNNNISVIDDTIGNMDDTGNNIIVTHSDNEF